MFEGDPATVGGFFGVEETNPFEIDERELSNELRNLGIGPDFLARGNDGQPKKEADVRVPCMYRQDNLPPYTGISTSHTHNAGPSGPPSMSAGVHGEVNQTWPPNFNGQGASLSSEDLEMDKDVSMPSSFQQIPSIPPQVKLEPGFGKPCHAKQNPGTGDFIFRQAKYPYEGKLARYTDDDDVVILSERSETEHMNWQQQTQSMSQPSSVGSSQADPMSMEDSSMQYELEQDEYGEGPLHWASLMTDKKSLAITIDALQKYQVVGQCINQQNKFKQTPLFLAVQAGNVPLIGWLLQNGANPNIQGTLYTDRDEYVWRSPLHLAVTMGDRALSVVKMLLTKSPIIDINITSHGDKQTPLHLALKSHSPQCNSQQIIYELLDHKADIGIKDQSSSKSPFILAIETRDVNLIQGFLEKYTAEKRRAILLDKTRSGDTCLHIAAGLSRFPSNQKEVLLRYLVTQGADGNVANNVKELPRDFARTEWEKIWNF